MPEAVTFKAGDRDVHAFYYPPTNPDVAAPAGDAAAADRAHATAGRPAPPTDVLDPKVQFWTSRGFAVLDVNYSGSTGYGRAVSRSPERAVGHRRRRGRRRRRAGDGGGGEGGCRIA